LKPYVAEELVSRIKEGCDIPLTLHCHATTGLSTATYTKAIEAGIDMLDTAISSMSMTYGHTSTETIVAMLQNTERDTGLNLPLLEEIAAYFRVVRKKYAKFEGSLRGTDSRILVAQVPGGMLTNMENQLREQNASDRLDDVLAEIPSVRKDLGYIPLVTPTSQIVGTQAVINVLAGERYKTISKETAGVLKGEYGASPAPVNSELQERVLEGGQPITCRPADLIDNEMDSLTTELTELAEKEGITLVDNVIDDVLIYAQFPQVGLKFLKNRGNPDAFEPRPDMEQATPQAPVSASGGPESYRVNVDGRVFNVQVEPGSGTVISASEQSAATATPAPAAPAQNAGEALELVKAPLAGTVIDIPVQPGDQVSAGQVVIIIEAMKMETQIRCSTNGHIECINVAKGESIQVDQTLLTIS
jgi:oxaloacetate decarboxylase alpha subunit